jgi:hypothetical protein
MKKIITLFIICFLANQFTFSQDTTKKDTAWKAGGLLALTISQAGFTNWAQGGENSYSTNGRLALFANYVKGNTAWENNLDMAYGRANQGGQGLRKTDDLLELNSKIGVKASKKWFYTGVLNAKTQFEDGVKYSEVDSIPDYVVSKPFAPFYLNMALGADYKPNKYTSLFLSPINMKNTYVSDVAYAERNSIDSAKHWKTDVGAIIKFKYEKEVVKNVNFLTKLELFANYLQLEGIDDVDVNWEVLLTMNVFKVFSININTQLIWDNDVKFVENNGDLSNARVQFKEIFGAGLAYKF